MRAFPTQATADIFLQGPVGQVEAISTWPTVTPQGIAIICHPHPLYQGTMRNKVVSTLAKTFAAMGLATLCFNYRGVGKSAGSYGEIKGEIADLLAVKAWVQQVLPGLPVWLAGFSFGAFIAAFVANQAHEVVQLVSVAPAVTHANFAELTTIQCPWLVIQGEEDEIVPVAAVQQFAAEPPSPLKLVLLADTSHFFHGKLLLLQQTVEQNAIKL